MNLDWHQQAACRTHPDPDLWFPTSGQHHRAQRAVTICRSCPVLAECRTWVDRHDPPYGIWAATTQTQRDEQRGHRGARRADRWVTDALTYRSKCGTPAGYARHKRRGETTCQPCRDANTRYVAERTKHTAPHTSTQHIHD